MRRTNVFKVKFDDPNAIMDRAIGCATLWNVINYRRRQSLFSGDFEWESRDEYDDFKGWVGAATAQEIIRKNTQAWRSYFRLIIAKQDNKIPYIKHISPPGYWKNRKTDELKLVVMIRCDCYKITGRKIKLIKGITGTIKGKPRWSGAQGALQIIYNRQNKSWYAHQSVRTEPLSEPSGHAKAFVDLGIKYPITAVIENVNEPIAFDGAPLLSDWWYWTRRIAETTSLLKKTNNKNTSYRLKKLYYIRRQRLHQSLNLYVRRFIEHCRENDVDEIIVGDLTGIRFDFFLSSKVNSMINNYWSHKYLTERLKFTAENYGIKTTLINEGYTSSKCPRCGSLNKIRRKRLFKCKDCRLEAHSDVVGAINISVVYGNGERFNWVMAHPRVVRMSSLSRLTQTTQNISQSIRLGSSKPNPTEYAPV